MFKCAWLKKLLGLKDECCCHGEEDHKAVNNEVNPVVNDGAEVLDADTSDEENSAQ